MTQAMPRVVVLGEALTDFLQMLPGVWHSRVGGACWNVARAVARLGVRSAFAGAVSRDELGDALARESARAGLDARFLQRADKPPLLALVPSLSPPRYFFAGGDSADLAFDPDALPEGWLEAAEVLHFGSIALAREPLASRLLGVARRARAAGKRVTFDPNWRNAMGEGYLPVFREMIGLADDVKLSDEDLAALMPGCAPREALGRLLAANPALSILYTEGARGLSLVTVSGERHEPARPVVVSDTVGAGDACLAGWIVATLERRADPLAFAAAAGAAACRAAGAHPPARDEVESLLDGSGGA
ncbi:fructokinase [Crenobacter luteus]|uniref:carbohydrate kinase family protein n=1 Tax=Crenobacter luteus TaxID=1452487 RepID=UPI001045B93B|nr:carbohydrate kinase [Crenobacter luteus]TCP08467.1 fructokinase [Crenobacter luteus]